MAPHRIIITSLVCLGFITLKGKFNIPPCSHASGALLCLKNAWLFGIDHVHNIKGPRTRVEPMAKLRWKIILPWNATFKVKINGLGNYYETKTSIATY